MLKELQSKLIKRSLAAKAFYFFFIIISQIKNKNISHFIKYRKIKHRGFYTVLISATYSSNHLKKSGTELGTRQLNKAQKPRKSGSDTDI